MSIALLPTVDDRMISLKMDGYLSAADIDQVVTAIEPKLNTTDGKVRLLIEIESWTGMSPIAFLKDFWFSLHHWRQFEREVIVSDLKWLSRMSQFFGNLVPGIEVQCFPTDQRDVAIAWVMQ